ncbi:cytochrome b5 [Metschnikowia bicuspidata]|uniref:Cytochrome b5 n=1 Tax=Metschnikowia bicuspidata TaxID=27322 RepID=A0A4P9ZGF5_9ASCO|nr:cytochrome b5 [Metschnikowia bicuspidata]
MSVRIRFNIIDVLRVLGGLLLLNALLSWHLTFTATWGYSGKWIRPHYLKHVVFGRVRHFTLEELRQYDGSDPSRPILLAINGSVYDVTASPGIYGPQGPYHFFSGRDAARAFVTGCFQKQDEFTYDLRGLNPQEVKVDIRGWQRYFANSGKYFYVGTVEHPPLTGEPPKHCIGQKFLHRG